MNAGLFRLLFRPGSTASRPNVVTARTISAAPRRDTRERSRPRLGAATRLAAALMLVSAAASTARAETADEILTRHKKALGGDSALGKSPSAVYTGTLTHQGFTRSFTWSALSPTLFREETRGDDLNAAGATDFRHDWVRLYNGVTLGLQGTERDPIRLMALILNHAYLTPDDVDLKLGEPKAEEGGKVWTLPVTGKGMAPFDLSFDAKSWQLIRASSRTAAGRLTLAFEDFRKASDLQVAYKVTRTLSRDGVDDTTLFTVQKVDRKAELEEGVFERPSEPTRAFKLPEGKTSEAVPVQVHPTHHLLVQVSIDGGEATPFLLDSAAPMSLIDATLAKKLGLKTAERIVDRHASGPRTYDVFPVQRLAVGGLELQKTVVGSADLSGLAKELSLPLGGILGMDALDRLVVELKYGAGTATFHDPGSYADPGTGEALPIDDFGRVNALINGQTLLSVVLDTGSGAAIDIPPALARKEKLEPPAEKRLPVAVAGPGNPKPAWLGQLESVQLGQLSVPRVVTVFQEPAGDAAKDQEAVAVVGNQLLERFNVTFDLPRRQVILEQGPWFSRPFAYDRSGLRFKAGSERVIEAVAEGTTADLKPGDQVVGVMTEKGLSKDSGVIEARFREPAGTKLTLKIRRGQLEQDRELVLRELLN